MVLCNIHHNKTKTHVIQEYVRGIQLKTLDSCVSSSTSSISLLEEFYSTTPSEGNSSTSIISVTWSPYEEQSYDFEWYKLNKNSSYILDWLSGPSISPKPTTSSERPSLDISTSKLTFTVLSSSRSCPDSFSINVDQASQLSTPNPFEGIDGLSVWTIETDSSGYVSVKSPESCNRLVRVKYPWSPQTDSSEADFTTAYPSTVSVLRCKETIPLRSATSVDVVDWLSLSVWNTNEYITPIHTVIEILSV